MSVRELDVLGNCDSVLGNLGIAEALVDDHVSTLGSESHLHGVGKDVDALEHSLSALLAVDDLLGLTEMLLGRLNDAFDSLIEENFG